MRRDGKMLLEGLSFDRSRHGKPRWFYRTKLGKKQLRGVHDEPPLRITPEVVAAYEDAKRRLDGAGGLDRPGTLGWLCDRYQDSAEFANLSPLTRANRRGAMKRLGEGGPDGKGYLHRPFATMTTRHVEVMRDELGGDPGNFRVKVLRYLFKWAALAKHATGNPAKDAALIRVASEGFTAWTREDILAFEDRHAVGTKARLALACFLYTGQRISDVAQFGPLNVRGGRLVYVQHKGKRQKIKRRSLPLVQPLADILAASPLGATTWLETGYGRPFTIKGLGNKMRQWCDEAGLSDLSAHGIRKATGVMAAERGCTAHQIMEMLGHDTLQEAERYTRAADAIRLADAGFARTFGGEP